MIACTIAATTTPNFAVFAVFGALMIGMLGWLWGIGDTYLSEFFRTSLRGTGFGIMVGGGRVVSIAAPFPRRMGHLDLWPDAALPRHRRALGAADHRLLDGAGDRQPRPRGRAAVASAGNVSIGLQRRQAAR